MVTPTIRGTGGAIFPWTKATLVERFNVADTLQIEGPLDALIDLANPGAAVDVRWAINDPDPDRPGGVVRRTKRWTGVLVPHSLRGQVTDGKYSRTATLTFASDLVWAWRRIVYPDPTKAWGAQGGAAYYSLGGSQPAETAALKILADQVVNAGDVARRVAWSLPASAGRGSAVSGQFRFDSVGQVIADLLEVSGLRLTVVGGVAVISQSPDLSGSIRYGGDSLGGPGVYGDWAVDVQPPAMTTTLGGGQGDLGARLLVEDSDASAVALWGRIESFNDQSNADSVAALHTANASTLAQGANPVSVTSGLPDVYTWRPGADVPVGARVRYDVAGRSIVDRLRTATTVWDASRITYAGTVGPEGSNLTVSQRNFLRASKALRKVQAT